jgi:hypothetical protein
VQSLTGLIAQLESYLSYIDKKNEAVSQVPVGWHIEHSLLAVIKMITAVENSDPSLYKKQFNSRRILVLTIRKFPRGVAKAPASVMPGEIISLSTILQLIEKAKEKIIVLEKLGKDKYFTHPVFGDLRLNNARKSIVIHTIHHLKIIKDIIDK